jgi:carbonic anhydrase/acetyltransferase-like protein (isoleucine patch superfamily)
LKEEEGTAVIRDFSRKTPTVADSAFVSEAAYVVGDVEIGEQASVWPGAVIRGDFAKIKIGRMTVVEDNSVIHAGADLVIGSQVIIGHGAVVHCSRIGNHVLIGSHATILDDVEIDDFCMIGAGSILTPGTRVPSMSYVLGIPGQVKGRLSAEQIARLKKGASTYAQLAQKYKQSGL